MERKIVAALPAFVEKFGYSQATRVGKFIAVSGTPARDSSGALVGIGDAYAQAKKSLENIKSALEQLGGSMENVVRSRLYIADMSLVWDIGRAHLEFFGEIKPATSMIEVTGFFDPNILCEFDVDAIVD